MSTVLIPGIVLCGALYVVLANRGFRQSAGIARVITIALIIGLAVSGLPTSPAPGFAWAMIAGLIFGIIGDIFFVLPQERFVPGLVSFLIGHVCYIYGAWAAAGFRFWLEPLPLLIAPLTLWVLRKVSAGMKEQGQSNLVTPAAVYSVVLAVMLWRATATLFAPMDLPFRPILLALGGAFFYFADAVMVWHRFVRPVPNQPLVEMGSYFVGQFCFAAAVVWAA